MILGNSQVSAGSASKYSRQFQEGAAKESKGFIRSFIGGFPKSTYYPEILVIDVMFGTIGTQRHCKQRDYKNCGSPRLRGWGNTYKAIQRPNDVLFQVQYPTL